MANLTLSIPDELYREMKKHPEIRWSEVARQALAKKLDDLKVMDRLLAGSQLRPEDVDALSGRIKEGVWKRHGKARTPASR